MRKISKEEYNKYSNVEFDDYKKFAKDPSLSKYNKIGFPDVYREEFEEAIFEDIKSKLPAVTVPGKKALSIGCGCSDNTILLMELCSSLNSSLVLVDAQEMLDILPDMPGCHKISCYFPKEVDQLAAYIEQGFDSILIYSVLHSAFNSCNPFAFLDAAVGLLAPGGRCLVGDIPNESKRRRFFSSPEGVAYHQKIMNDTSLPVIEHFKLAPGKFDDAMVFSILQRYRDAGFETYLLPENEAIHFSNRREDIVIIRH